MRPLHLPCLGLLSLCSVLSLTTSALAAPSPTSLIAQVPDPSQIRSPDPNRDQLIQPTAPPSPLPIAPPLLPTSSPSTPTSIPSNVQFTVRQVEVVGSTVFKPTDPTIRAITQPLEGKTLTLADLQAAANQITQLYLNRGYITSRAIVGEQAITNGVVQIQVIEGALEEIRIEGNQRLKPSYVRRRVQLGSKPPLSRADLEDQLRLLRIDSLFTDVEASLQPGSKPGTSILVVRVKEAPALSGFVGADNYSPPSVGSVRLGGGLTYRNLTGYGDTLSASYFGTITGGANNFDFNYTLPVNPMNGTVQLRVAPNNNRVTDSDFKALDIRGRSELYEFSFRQPLIRTPRQELALSVGFAAQNGQTFIFNDLGVPFGIGPDAEGNSRTRVLKFGQDYLKRDLSGAWALRSQFNFGLNVLNATENPGSIPDGQFFSWLGQVQRVQRLGANHLLIAQADLQLTPDTLLPSQQFVVGGGQILRGFRQNARSGDNGFRVSLEDRIALVRNDAGEATLQVAPFVDLGKVWNTSGNPNRLPSQTFLAGAGLGILWQPVRSLNVRLDYGIPLLRLKDRGNDVQDQGFYFSVYYLF